MSMKIFDVTDDDFCEEDDWLKPDKASSFAIWKYTHLRHEGKLYLPALVSVDEEGNAQVYLGEEVEVSDENLQVHSS